MLLIIIAALLGIRWRTRIAYRRGLKAGAVGVNSATRSAEHYERMWCDALREIATLRDELKDCVPAKHVNRIWADEAGRN